MATTQVILRTKVENLGAEADLVEVKAGFARNYLLPQGLAYEATRANRRHTEALLAARAEREAQELKTAEMNAQAINRLNLTMKLETGEGGKAFGSITNVDIATRLEDEGIEIDRHKIVLDTPIKSTGEKEITIKLHADVESTLRLNVKANRKAAAVESEEA